MTELPRPPEMLRRDSMNDWRFDRSTAAAKGVIVDGNDRKAGNYPLYSFLSTWVFFFSHEFRFRPIIKRHVSSPFLCRLDRDEAAKFAQFETKFKKFLYCGVSVQHLKPNSAANRSGMTRREKRTLWLMLPEVGSLRLGFVSKIKDNGSDISMDDNTVASSVASSSADANVRIVVRQNLRILSFVRS